MKKSQWMVYTTILFCFILCSSQASAQADLVIGIKCPSPSVAAPGQKLGDSISVWVRNQGNKTAAKVVIDLFLSTDRKAADKHKVYKANFEEDVLLQGGRYQIQNLAPGQTVKVTMNDWNKIPADTPPGNYYIGVLADPHNLNNEPRATRGNNMTFCGIRIGTVARFRVTRVRAMITPRTRSSYVGKCPFRFSFTGHITANGPCMVKYQWKRIDNATAPVKTLRFTKAGTQRVTSYWQLGGAGKTYTKYWKSLAIVAPNKMMSNKAYFNLRCTGGSSDSRKMPDLIVSDIALVQGCKIKVTLKNIGTAGVPAAKYNLPKAVGVQMYKGSKAWGGIILKGFDAAGKLKVPGGTASWIWFPKAANLNLTPGTHSIRVVVDHLKNLTELKETNNSRTERLTCGQSGPGRKLPDLIVSDIALVRGCKVKITLKNIGTAGVPAAKYNLPKAVGVQTYMDGKPWGGIILSGFDKAGKLKVPGGTASWILFPASKTLPPGTHSVKVIVDHLKNLTELKETNNSRTERLTCGSGTPPYANKPCGVRLTSLSKTSGYPGETFRLIGTWGASQGPKLPCINKGKMNKLIVRGWSNTAIRVQIPTGLAPGMYRVGVYCHSLSLGKTYSSGWLDFEVKSRTGGTTAPRLFQVIYPTNSQHFALTNNKVVITVRFNRPVKRNTVIVRRTFRVSTETDGNAAGTLKWNNSREVVFTSTKDYGQLCRFNPDCFFKVIIQDSVKDTGGNALDGDKNGAPGGTFEHDFTIVG